MPLKTVNKREAKSASLYKVYHYQQHDMTNEQGEKGKCTFKKKDKLINKYLKKNNAMEVKTHTFTLDWTQKQRDENLYSTRRERQGMKDKVVHHC